MARAHNVVKGSGGGPLLSDYLRLNQGQGAQEASALANRLNQQNQQAMGAVDAAQSAVEAQRMGAAGGALPEMFSELATQQAPNVLTAPAATFATSGVNGAALQQQVGQAAANGQLAQSAAGLSALGSNPYGYLGAGYQQPATAGGSLLEGALMQNAGGKQLRAAGRKALSLQDYLGGAEQRGNDAAVARAKALIQPPSTAPVVAAPAVGSAVGTSRPRQQPQLGQYLGTTYVPPTSQAPAGNQTIGTTPVQAPTQPKKGGRYVGTTWVPYG